MDSMVARQATATPLCESTRWKDAVSELADARLRQLVAERLGVEAGQLSADASLVDDLGADETDLLEIAVALEEEFGLVVSDTVLGELRTYGDLAGAVGLLLQSLDESDAAELLTSRIVRVRVIRNRTDDGGTVLRAARLTPRVLERIIDEVLWTTGVVRVDVTCAGDTTDRQLARIAQHLAWLRNRGVQVSVQRSGQETTGAAPGHTDGDTVSQPVDIHAAGRPNSPTAARGTRLAG